VLQKDVLEGDEANGNRDEEESEMASQDGCSFLDPLQPDYSAQQHGEQEQHADKVSGQAQVQDVRQQVSPAVDQSQQPQLQGDDKYLSQVHDFSPFGERLICHRLPLDTAAPKRSALKLMDLCPSVSEHIPKIVGLVKLGIFMVRLLFLPNSSLGLRNLLSPLGQSRDSTVRASFRTTASTNAYIK